MAHFLQVLENDLRLLSAEARRNDGFGGFFTGASFPELKEAAERAILQVRSLPVNADPAETLAGVEVRVSAPMEKDFDEGRGVRMFLFFSRGRGKPRSAVG